ncbi:MAG: ABC transporter permease [Acidocella sp.]|nr:ABC transporter permease [Acidocella sp.]
MNLIVPDHGKAEISRQHSAATSRPPIVIAPSRGWRDGFTLAAADIAETVRLWPLVWTLSFFDIRLRYRGSLLGPFWLTLSTAIMVASIGFLYAKLFHQDVSAYLPFLAISLVLWNFINTITSEGATCLTQSEGMIRSMRMPHSLHAARVVMRNVLVLGHNLIVIVVVFAIFRTTPNISAFSLIPACLLWAVDGFAVCLLLGIFGARFRDIPPIIGSIMQIAFYMTPIMWSPTMLMHRGFAIALVKLNPFFSLLEIVRGPLLNMPLEPEAWTTALAYSAVLLLLTTIAFIRARSRIPYWV